MAASAMTPKLLNRISNEKYQEKDKWKIDDIALGPANELLISGHSLEKPEAFISMHKEDSGKYDNRPEFSRSFHQSQPQSGEQLALFLEGSSVIGLKTECALRLFTTESMGFLSTLWWKQSPTCVCFYRGKLYAASSSSTIVSVCNLDSEDKNDIVLSDMRNDCVLEIVVVMEKLYVCTKEAGRALVFSMTGSKEMEFKTAIQTDAMAKSMCIHERTELVFVSWNNFQIQLYSQKTSRCLRALDMTEKLHKIRVTTENILVTLSESKCIVAVYDVGEVIKTGELKKNILSSVEKKQQKKLMSNDEEKLECHPANSDTLTNISSPLKSASKHSKVEKLRDMQLNDIKQLEENENLRRKSDRDIQKIYDATLELTNQKNDVTNELKKEQSIWKKKKTDCLQIEEELHTAISQKMDLAKTVTKTEELYQIIDAKEKHIQQLRMRLKKTQTEMENAKTQVTILQNKKEELEKSLSREQGRAKTLLLNVVIKSRIVEDRNTKLEAEVTQLKKQLQAKEKTSKELQTSSLKQQNERIKELEGIRRDLESRQNKLKETLVQEKGKVTREERSRVQLNERMKELEGKIMALESQQKNLEESLFTEKRKVSREERSRVQLNERIKELELTRAELEYQQKQLKQNLVIEKGKVTREESSRVQMRRRRSRENMNMPAAKIQNDEPGFTTDPAIDHEEDQLPASIFTGNYFNLVVAANIGTEGGELEIPGTKCSINIPPKALRQPEDITIRIVHPETWLEESKSFASNSFSIIELLPNNLKLYEPAKVKIPHCLQIARRAKLKVEIYFSHHEENCQPHWEKSTEHNYKLEEDVCTVYTSSFCWIKVEIDDQIVEAKKIQVFATVPTITPEDSTSVFTIGYCLDLPGLRMEKEAIEKKCFLFKKDKDQSLTIALKKTVPKFWNNQPPSSPQEIPFSDIELSKDSFRKFPLLKSSNCRGIPMCIFTVSQGKREITLSVRSPISSS